MDIGRFQNIRVSEYDMENMVVCFDFDGGLSPEIIKAALEEMRKEYVELRANTNRATDATPIMETATCYIAAALTLGRGADIDITASIEAVFTDGWDDFVNVRNIFTEEEAAALKTIALDIFRAHFTAIFDRMGQLIQNAVRTA